MSIWGSTSSEPAPNDPDDPHILEPHAHARRQPQMLIGADRSTATWVFKEALVRRQSFLTDTDMVAILERLVVKRVGLAEMVQQLVAAVRDEKGHVGPGVQDRAFELPASADRDVSGRIAGWCGPNVVLSARTCSGLGVVVRQRIARCAAPRSRRLSSMDPTGLTVSRRTLSGAHLNGAILQQAILHTADLMHADLRGVDLRGADLTNTDLTHADLHGADLTNANMEHTKFDGADLTDVKGLKR